MESNSRNLMILYAVIAFLSIVAVVLNFVSMSNLVTITGPDIDETLAYKLRNHFLILAALYLTIATIALLSILKKSFTKSRLIVLTILLISVFVFGPYIFEIL